MAERWDIAMTVVDAEARHPVQLERASVPEYARELLVAGAELPVAIDPPGRIERSSTRRRPRWCTRPTSSAPSSTAAKDRKAATAVTYTTAGAGRRLYPGP
jgi:hypothetical protein